MNALRGCPFCGVIPERNGYGFYHTGNESREIRCENTLCHVKPGVTQNQSEYGEWSLEDAWNDRAEQTEPTPQGATQ